MSVRKRELSIGVLVLVIATSAYLLGWTNLFTVKKVELIGAPNPEVKSAVLKISDIKLGEKMARIEPRSIESALEKSGIGWLESVDISRNWISGKVLMQLKARQAIAISGSQYVDIEGVLFTSPIQLPKQVLAKLPELSGSDTQSRADGIDLYLNLPEDFKSRVREITVSSQGNYQFTIGEKLRVRWGNSENSAIKAKIFAALIKLPENKKITLMDLSNPTKPSVK